MKEYKDASGRLSIDLSDSDSRNLFRQYANQIEKTCNAKIIEKLYGIDQQYLDFEVTGTIVVLQSDAMAGISIHIKDGSNDELLRDIAKALFRKRNEQRRNISIS